MECLISGSAAKLSETRKSLWAICGSLFFVKTVMVGEQTVLKLLSFQLNYSHMCEKIKSTTNISQQKPFTYFSALIMIDWCFIWGDISFYNFLFSTGLFLKTFQ